MAYPTPASPYDDQDIEEIDLRDPPLVRVIAQVRHPPLTALIADTGKETALRVAEGLSASYPIFEETRDAQYIVTSDGIEERQTASSTWHLRSADEQWQVSFGREFVALDASSYAGRNDFHVRLEEALRVYAETVSPPSATRLGIRYTNRIEDQALLADMPRFIRQELLGPLSSDLPREITLAHVFSQAQFNEPAGGLVLNWGLLPPNGLFDPTLKPLTTTSWVLDIDAFSSTRLPFDPTSLVDASKSLADRAYRSFRWAVKEDFLQAFRSSDERSD